MLSATCYKNESTMCEQMTALINLEQDIIYSSIGYLGLDLLYECLRQKKKYDGRGEIVSKIFNLQLRTY